jgi:hypothetical protein
MVVKKINEAHALVAECAWMYKQKTHFGLMK